MTQLRLTEEQQVKLVEALSLAKLAEEKAGEMSELATAIADKYQKRLYEAALSALQKSGD